MRSKAVFLDRDGTINVEKNYLYEIDKFEFLPGVLEGLRRLKDAGYDLIIESVRNRKRLLYRGAVSGVRRLDA